MFESLEQLGDRAGWGADPERAAAAVEDRDRLDAALRRLDPDDREVIWLRDVEGLDGPTVATLLGHPLATVKSRLHRARLRLMATLHEEEKPHGR